jgi:gas vesicle protein GvpG
VGLLTGIVTLPLAPVRATVWLAERLVDEANRELGDESTIRRRLAEAEIAYELGQIDIVEYESIEDALLLRLEQLREEQAGRWDG